MGYEIGSLKGYSFGVQYMWEKEIFCQGRVINHAIGWKTHDILGARLFMHMGWDSCQTCEVFTSNFSIISARKYSVHLTHPQPDSDNSRRSREWACKELLLTKGFWRDLGKTKQNIGQWNIFDFPWAGSVFIVMANISALHILLTVFYSSLCDNGGDSRIRAKEIIWQKYAS